MVLQREFRLAVRRGLSLRSKDKTGSLRPVAGWRTERSDWFWLLTATGWARAAAAGAAGVRATVSGATATEVAASTGETSAVATAIAEAISAAVTGRPVRAGVRGHGRDRIVT